ncbi:C40 family peptidase, partial [Parafrankia sp. FMc2]|uniref:C40 family peptidase n=1 Tax=Parafrankia sp. FMc2 TaxID=3233196 RepID=UPI0034D67730
AGPQRGRLPFAGLALQFGLPVDQRVQQAVLLGRAVQEAHAQLGKPYVWGGEGPNSFDCSGLTQWVWGKAGVGIPHYTGDQWTAGRRVSRAELIPGDLVFFGADLYHVGLYIGGGQMIHAPRTGEVIRIEDVWWSSFQGGVRPGA